MNIQLFAGMPSLDLSEIGRARLDSISMFAFLFVLATVLVWGCWRFLRREFPRLPELTIRSAFVLVALWGFIFLLALTMVSGARELLTPGAWEKQGWTYRLTDPSKETSVMASDRLSTGQWEPEAHEKPVAQRQERLRLLGGLLTSHAESHEGLFPPSIADAVTNAAWLTPPGLTKADYLYYPQTDSQGRGDLLLAEPDLYREARFGYLTGGVVVRLDLLDIPPDFESNTAEND